MTLALSPTQPVTFQKDLVYLPSFKPMIAGRRKKWCRVASQGKITTKMLRIKRDSEGVETGIYGNAAL
jgi:hypothetical protein